MSSENKRGRIEQRKRQITYGKNTIGYQNYITLIPKHKRKIRSMETPMTPNPNDNNIPNRRWNGLVKAWRISLHKYDDIDITASSTTTLLNNDANTATISSQQNNYSSYFITSEYAQVHDTTIHYHHPSSSTSPIIWNNNYNKSIPIMPYIETNINDDYDKIIHNNDEILGQKHVIDSIEKIFCNE